MSLPPAQKDISTHPAKGSVVAPVDKAAKEADVDRKIKLYGILSALRAGKLPSNAQINDALDHILSSTLATSSTSRSAYASTSRSTAASHTVPEGTPATQYTTTNTTAKYANLSAQTAHARAHPGSTTHSGPTTHPGSTSTHPSTNATGKPTTNAASRLSPAGQTLIHDLTQIIESTKLILQEKNADEMMQDFVWGVRGVEFEKGGLKGVLVGEEGDGDLPVGREKVRGDAQVATKHLLTLLTLLLSNAELRKLLTDFSVIGRDILARGASSAAQTIAPSPSALADVDNPAKAEGREGEEGEGEFVVGVGGERRALRKGEEPVLEARIPGTGVGVIQRPGDEFGYGAEVVGGQEGGGKKVRDIRNDAVGVAGEALGKGVGKAKGHVDDVANADADDGEVDDVVEAKKGGVMGKMRQMRDTVRDNFSSASDKVPQEHKDLAREKMESGRKLFSEEYFPRERREQFLWRGKKVILELQKHDNYQESIRWLIAYVKEYLGHGRSVGRVGVGRVRGGVESSNLSTTLSQLRTILERFANGTSLDTVFDAVDALGDDARRDDALRVWWESVGVYVEKILLEPGYILEPQSNTHARKLVDLGREFYEGKYRAHFEAFFDAVAGWVGGVGEDPINKQFAGDWARMTKDLLFDSEGSLKFKPELWNDIRKVILPAVIDQIGYIPIPRIEYTDEALDLVVENLTLQGRNLLPNIVSLEANNFIRFSAYSAISSNDERGMPLDAHGNPVEEMLNRHKVSLHLEQMQADMRDVAFYYRKKTGIPKMKDSGIADVVVGGQGLSILIELISSPPQDRTSVFKIHNIQVKLDTLKFSIRDSNHDFLYKTLRPLATGLIKKQVRNAVRDAVRTGLEYLDGQLVGVRERMREGKEEMGNEGVLRDIFARATNKNTTSTKEKADDVLSTATGGARSTGSSSAASASSPTKSSSGAGAGASQFKIVADKRNSILADQGNPVGWVNRVEERRGMVGDVKAVGGEEGKGWKSDAFHVV